MTAVQAGANQGVPSTQTVTTTEGGTQTASGNALSGGYTQSGGGTVTVTKPVSGSDGRGPYSGTVTSTDTSTGTASGNHDTGSSGWSRSSTGSQTASVAGGSGASTYTGTTSVAGGSSGSGSVDGASGANGRTHTAWGTQTVGESGSAPGVSYDLLAVSTTTSTDTAGTDPASGRTTATHTASAGGSVHQTGDGSAGYGYTFDKTSGTWAGSTRVDDPSCGLFTLSGTGGETSTAVEVNAHGAAGATFTEILSDTASRAGSGSSAGHYTLTQTGTRTAGFVQGGTIAAGSYSVNEGSSGGYTGTTTGYAGVAETTATEAATITHTATQTVGGASPFTLVGTGVDTSTGTTTANGVTGVTASAGTGTDVYTLTETGTATGGGYTQTVTGTDSYAESHAGNSQAQTSSGTVTGGGAWSRTSSGTGSTLASGSGTNAYTHTTSANELAGVFGQTLTGDTRYQLVQRFEDVSNANGGSSPGHVKFNSHGLPFRDPGPEDVSELAFIIMMHLYSKGGYQISPMELPELQSAADPPAVGPEEELSKRVKRVAKARVANYSSLRPAQQEYIEKLLHHLYVLRWQAEYDPTTVRESVEYLSQTLAKEITLVREAVEAEAKQKAEREKAARQFAPTSSFEPHDPRYNVMLGDRRYFNDMDGRGWRYYDEKSGIKKYANEHQERSIAIELNRRAFERAKDRDDWIGMFAAAGGNFNAIVMPLAPATPKQVRQQPLVLKPLPGVKARIPEDGREPRPPSGGSTPTPTTPPPGIPTGGSTPPAAPGAPVASGKVQVFPDKATARQAGSGPQQAAAKEFFGKAGGKSRDFKVTELEGGGKRFEHTDPSRDAGGTKRYIQEVDAEGNIVYYYKETIRDGRVVDTKPMPGYKAP